ncbi:phage tail assembly protein [Cytobacillus firmus]|uniref:phage tail assembly protein n=1 Tax=Cytobacillus firmus TaxID=1399 RepID=UPI0018CF4481|nr:phage tail assembly protein [Cytobacillus firmus]MBG9548387.1 hypothetical protein [Cytobacillus firmus]MBG9604521.1 hypothetical protein [Cytobacillus firmus]MED1942139.1 phage tail assembly protein [Cytobacillus firmus]
MPNQTIETTKGNELLLKFKEPYKFEGQEYTEVDLSPVKNLNGNDIIDTDRIFTEQGNMSMVPETTFPYMAILAARATGMPIEFFNQLPIKEALQVKRTIMGFLNK